MTREEFLKMCKGKNHGGGCSAIKSIDYYDPYGEDPEDVDSCYITFRILFNKGLKEKWLNSGDKISSENFTFEHFCDSIADLYEIIGIIK